MTDGQAAETPPGTPSRRALGAMESAVRRARETQGDLAPPRAPTPLPLSPPGPTKAGPADQQLDQEPVSRRPESWLLAAVVGAAVLVVAGAIALAVSLSGNPPPSTPSASTTAAPHTSSVPQHSNAGGTKGGPTASGTGRASTTTTASPPSGPVGAPMISSLTPSSGSAGEGVQITGANFLSSDGQIVARFNGQVAPTSCPTQNTCTVTVPPQSAGSSARVSITTASGTSNVVTFTYG